MHIQALVLKTCDKENKIIPAVLSDSVCEELSSKCTGPYLIVWDTIAYM